MVIDIFCHHISRPVGKIIEREKYYGKGKQFPYPIENADAEIRLEIMESYGISIQALSQTAPVLLGFGPEDAAEICRDSNTDNYALCKAYPDKFVNICIISLLDMKSAMKELERSVSELDCRGITIASNHDGKGIDSPEYFPFYEKLAEYDLPLFLQPTHWESYPLIDMDLGYQIMAVLGWPFDTSQAVLRLIFGGVIDRYPSLKIVTHHMGAMLPFFSGRISSIYNRLRYDIKQPVDQYWGNIYGDTAIDGDTTAYHCGYAFFGPDRMMYGSDYPFGGQSGEDHIRKNLAGVLAMDIPEEMREKILWGNAKKLLKIN